MINRKEKSKYIRSKQKIATLLVFLTVVIAATIGVAHADMDVVGSLTSWYAKKTGIMMDSLEQSMQSDTEKQKTILKKEVELRLQASSQQLDQYTEEQKKIHAQAIQQYAESLLQKIDIKTEQDRQQLLDKLLVIIASAEGAMDTLSASYVPPEVVFLPAQALIMLHEETPGSSVTEGVYGQQLSSVVEVTYGQ
jgi:hypothetical protein